VEGLRFASIHPSIHPSNTHIRNENDLEEVAAQAPGVEKDAPAPNVPHLCVWNERAGARQATPARFGHQASAFSLIYLASQVLPLQPVPVPQHAAALLDAHKAQLQEATIL